MKKEIDKIIDILELVLVEKNDKDALKILENFFESLDENNKQLSFINFDRVIRKFETQIQIYLFSLLLELDKTPKYLIEILKLCISDEELDVHTKYFILYQFTHRKFTNHLITNSMVEELLRKLYYTIYDVYDNTFSSSLDFISKEQRNDNLIFVFTPQFLGINHAPTRRVLDRCVNLLKLGYEILLINTAEVLSTVNYISIYDPMGANYLEEFSSLNSMEYEGYQIPYYQSSQNTPNVAESMSILGIIQEYKPKMIFSFGNYCITSDLASHIVPVANVPFSYDLPVTKATFHVKVGMAFEEDYEILEKFEISKESLVIDSPNYHLKKQQKNLTKEELGLPSDKFILALVGNRLDDEISDAFIEKLLETLGSNTHLAFIGKYNGYEKLVNQNQVFKDNSTNLGYQSDVFAVYEHCNLYINPKRSGGGASSVEALSMGVPVITLRYGDVYFGAGSEFGVDDEKSMVEKITHLATDKSEYENMVSLAKKRVEILTDTKTTLEKLIENITNNKHYL